MHLRPLSVWIRRTPLRRTLTAIAGLIAVRAVGLLDYVTGSGLSFAGFYVIVIVAVTVAGGAIAGVLAGVASAGVWGVAEALTGRADPGLLTQIGNGVVRCTVHVTVVFLVSALLRARDAARESEARSRAFLASAPISCGLRWRPSERRSRRCYWKVPARLRSGCWPTWQPSRPG